MAEQHAAIVAVITTKPSAITGGGAPVFIASNQQELQNVSLTLEKIMDATAHEIDEDMMVIVAR